jgi:predicted ATPase
MNFYVVSAGKPGEDYVENNFKDITSTKEFALYAGTKQKGTYFSIEKQDVLILKYEREFVAYGIVVERYENSSKDFSLRVKVEEWVFFDKENPKKGVSRYGIQKATIGGGRYGTVKTIRPNFGLDKIKEIDSKHPSCDLIFSRYKKTSSNLQKDGDHFELHEEIFIFLLDKTDIDSEFTFVIRDSNNSSRLDIGYWFYGEETVAISFWTGMDHFNKRPAISFLINPNDYCKLVIQTDIYPYLKKYLEEDNILSSKLGLKKENKIFEKEYNKYQLTDYVECLNNFFKNDFITLNSIIGLLNDEKTKDSKFIESSIFKFPNNEFNSRLNNLFRYRQNDSAELTLYSIEDENKADSLKRIAIKDYALIKDEELVFGDSKWVFITGENGSGKTMLLRAIGSALGNRTLLPKELKEKNFNINAEFLSDSRTITFRRNQNENVRAKRAIVSRGLAMYGPYRLQQTSSLVKDETFRKSLSKTGSFESLFEDGSKLLSFDKQLELWTTNSRSKKVILESRLSQILSLLPRLIPDLRIVEYKKKKQNKYDFEYLIQTQGSDELMPLKWHELSSGNKNILNLVSDIIIRLFHQQPKITDPSELRGIILIDEIDLHLHPKAQRDLVVTLSETFPLLQFIVSTHSPIPLLGAPENSSIFVVKRDWKRGVYATRLHDLEENFKKLLPNALLTSDLFDLEEINHKDVKAQDVNTSDSFDKYQLDTELDKQLNILKAKDDETFNDFIK